MAVHKIKPVLLLNKPIYVGFSILELSKMSGKIIAEFVGLRSKMYSIVIVDDEKLVRAKGVNRELMHSEFKDVLFDKKVGRHCMKRILAKGNKIGTYDICKISLSCFDDKRFVLDDGVNSLAYGHTRIIGV